MPRDRPSLGYCLPFNTRWEKLNASKEVQLFGRLHSDLFNVPLVLLPGVSLQIRLTKSRPSFYMMSKEVDSKTTFKFLGAELLVKRVKPDPVTLLAHTATLNTGSFARYNMSTVDLKKFTFSAGSKSLSTTPSWFPCRNISSSTWLRMPIL